MLQERDLDRRGYVRVSPGDFSGMTYQRAARIAREEGLRAEAFGNRGYWRFGDKVVEEVEERTTKIGRGTSQYHCCDALVTRRVHEAQFGVFDRYF